MRLPQQHITLWRLAGPIMLSNITVALLGIVDTAVVGHLDESWYLGGVTLATVIFNFLYWGFAFLRMGTTGIIAQKYGESDSEKIRSSLAQASILAGLLALLILLAQSFISNIAFSVLDGSSEVKYYANIYYDWAIWAAPAVLLNLVITGWLLGMHSARSALFVAVFINLLNIVLDIVFVQVFYMDVRGVALATVIAQFAGLFLGIFLCRKLLGLHPGQWRRDLILHLDDIREMMGVNHNIFIRTLSLIFVLAFFTHQGASQSDTILAANAVLMNFYLLMALGLDGFATASEALVGKSVGAKDNDAFWLSVKTATSWGLIFSVLYVLFYLSLGSQIINLMTDIEEVRLAAKEYLIWLAIAPLLAVICYMWDGIFIGARRAVEMRNSMLLSTFAVFLPAWYLSQELGNHGLWFAMSLFLVARSVTMSLSAYNIEKHQGFVKR